jgi:hypothetical protein
MRNVTKMLQVLTAFFLMAFVFATQVNAQVTLFTESFESAAVGQTPPAGWATDVVVGSNYTWFQSAGTWPTTTPYDGVRMVEFQSFNASTGYQNRLKRTTALSTVGYSNVGIDFQWYEDPGYSGNADKVDVQWSTDGSTWTTVGSFNRYNAVAGWKLKNVTLPSGANGQATLYIAFLFTSAYGNNCHMDLVHVTAVGPPPPATVTVGTGSNSCQWPYSTYWMGGRTQMLYTAAEILAAGGGPGLISQIGFNVTSYNSQTMQSFNINFQSTTATALTGWVNSGWTNAYSGTYAVTGTGWQMITLQTPYVWTGDNLLVEVCYGSNGSYTYYSFVTGTTTPTNTVYHYEMDNQTGCSMTSGSAYNNRPNLRFVEQPYVGTVMGTVTSNFSGLPLSGANVAVTGMTPVLTNPSGGYTVYNVPIGSKTVTASFANYVTQQKPVTVTNNNTSTIDFALDPIPGVLAGIVTNASTGAPIIGAKIQASNPPYNSTAYSVTGGAYTLNVYPVGTFPVTCSKTGFDNGNGSFTFVQGNTLNQDFALLENTNPPTDVVAVLNSAQTAANISWGLPFGNYEILYDDGIPENFAVWAVSGNQNAVKFTPVGYPATVYGGKVNIGTINDYPAGSNPLVPFKMAVYDDDGAGGLPGTALDTVDVTPTAFGWVEFTLPSITVTSGSFYLVMIQGGNAPDAAGIAVDETNSQLHSYARFVTGSGPWVPASGNFLMRALVTGSGGPLLLDASGQTITAGPVPGTLYQHTPATVTGVPGAGQIIPVTDNGETITGYQIFRLKQGEEGTPGVWNSVGTTTAMNTTDPSWPSLACGPYRWGVETIFTGNRFSTAAFSNVIGKCWTAGVTVNVALTCAANPKAGSQVKLVNNAYPDTLYIGVTDTNGTVVFPTVWKGQYTLTVTRFTYPVTSQIVDIMGDMTINVPLLQDKKAPKNLFVDAKTLDAIWEAPRVAEQLLYEDWSGGFAANQWVVSGSHWIIAAVGNPAPAAEFTYGPNINNYTQTITSKTLTGMHAPQQILNFDLFLSNYGTTTTEQMAVEVWDGSAWTQVANYDNQGGNIPWTTENVDLTAYTDISFKIRFNAYGEQSYSINYWAVDNISVIATDGTVGLNPCVLGYNFYLNGVTTGFTTDTTYVIPSTLVAYGQTYNACVAAVYGSGYSAQDCFQFTSSFLCPAADLTATAVENSAYLTWSKPQCTGGDPKCYVYDDGTMENGWTFNPGYNLWLGNQFTAPATDNGVINEFKILWWNNPNATNQTLTIDMFSLTGVLLGTTQPFTYTIPAPSTYQVVTVTTPIPFTGPFYGMLHYNNFSGLTHWVGYDQTAGQGGTYDLGYAYDGATFTKWNNYAGAGTGTFCIQACGLVNSDNSGMMPVTYGNIPPAGNAPASAGILSRSPEGATAPAAATPPPTPEADNLLVGSGLLGYNVYIHEGSFVQYVPGPDSLSTYVFNLDPGTYCFDVKAYYDLTVYGFPGQFDESMPIGPACVDLMYGRPLPFFEPWDQGSFGYNDWSFAPLQGNWTMNTGEGNPAPSADFSWQPVAHNYEYSLESPVLNAGPWTCSSLWFDFDYKLIDRNATGNEKLFAEVYYGGTWHQKAEIDNNGSTNWVPQHIDISGGQGKALKVRFRAAGANSDDILHWYVDNIHIYGICNSPTALTATQASNNVTLTWTAPECTGGGGGVVMQFIFDDGSAENGWAINPGYSQWIGNEFPIAATYQGVIQSFDVFFYYTPPGPDMMTIDIFDATQTVVGTSDPFAQPDNTWATVLVNDVPFAGMFYGMVHWNMVASPTNYLGIDEDGPYSGQDLEWYFDGTTWDKFSNMGYNAGVMLVRATALVGGDLKKVTIVPGQKPTGHITNTAALRKSDAKFDTKNYTQMGPVKDSDSSQIIGYNVYRTDLGAQPPYNKLNSAPVTATTYLDVLPNNSSSDYGQYKYYVTSVFNDSQTNTFLCESPGLDTIMIQFPAVGVNEIGKENVQIYPNPATQFVNVKSTLAIHQIEVMNFVGQTITTMKNVESKTARIDVSTVSAGVYFVKVYTSEGVRTAKITVTR